MRRTQLLAVAAGLLAVLLGWSTADTSASWVDAAALGAGRVRSGELSLTSGDGTTQLAAYRFDALQASELRPGAYGQAPLVLGNDGSVALSYRLARVDVTDRLLGAALTLAVTPVGVPADCPTGPRAAAPLPAASPLYTGTLVGLTGTVPRPLAPRARETLCVRVGLPLDAPAVVQDARTSVVLRFRAVTA